MMVFREERVVYTIRSSRCLFSFSRVMPTVSLLDRRSVYGSDHIGLIA